MSASSAGLLLVYLPPNQSWTFVFGTALVGMGDRILFHTREDAVEAARECGLRVRPDGRAEAIRDADGEIP